MSHEGIRFLREQDARREEAADRELPREAKEPAHVRVNKSTGLGLKIDWKDGHKSSWTFAWLREACPCATCHGERGAEGREPGVPRTKPAAVLPIYHDPPRPDAVAPVGRYALSFEWNDGHKSGIYSWDYLRRHCQCEECRQGRK